MPSITIRVDRRSARREEILDELRSLEQTIKGLTVESVDDASFDEAPDAGKFRDFVALARVSHERAEPVEWVAEELVDLFGWIVDVGR